MNAMNESVKVSQGSAPQVMGVVKVSHLAAILKGLKTAVSKDSTRHSINETVLIESTGNELIFVATNGHVLAKYRVPCETKFKSDGKTQHVTSPAEIEILLKTAKMRHATEVEVTGVEPFASFPQYQRVIPEIDWKKHDVSGRLFFDPEYMAEAYAAATAVAKLQKKVLPKSAMHTPEERCPTVIEARGDGVTLLYTVMPLRGPEEKDAIW